MTQANDLTRRVLRQDSYRRDRETDKVHWMAKDLDTLLGAHPGTCRPLVCLVTQPGQPVTQCASTYVLGVGSLLTWLATPRSTGTQILPARPRSRDRGPRGRHVTDW